MQAQTARKSYGTVHKLAGGLLIAAALAAGAIGLTTIAELEIPGAGSDSDSASAPVSAPYVAPYYGEGLLLSPETPAVVADAVARPAEETAFIEANTTLLPGATRPAEIQPNIPS
jgi:hypothetical protein